MSIPQQATTQELCDYAVTKLIEQGAPSIRVSDMGSITCLYRGADGKACPVGHLIADEHYNSGILEMLPAGNELVLDAVSASIGRALSDGDSEAFTELQQAHDSAADLSRPNSHRYVPWLIALSKKLNAVPLSDAVRTLVKEAADAERNES